MHGIKRTRITPQAAEVKRLKEQAKIVAYANIQEEVLQRKRNHDYSREALKRTADLLDLNPEFYTVWNYRRHILVQGLFPTSSPDDIVALLSADIRLTFAYLQVHPKVYWIWNHRKWCLENVPLGPGGIDAAVEEAGPSTGGGDQGKSGPEGWRNEFWKTELRMLEAMLDADPRNSVLKTLQADLLLLALLTNPVVHAWGYRRYVIRSLPPSFMPARSVQDELRYTRKKIESNFSNFSAWHLRTKLLGGLWEDLQNDEVVKEKDKEFQLVTQALWTDPNDQSGWLYHRWLLGSAPEESILRREIKNVRDLHETEPDSKWCMNALAHYDILLAASASTEEQETQKLKSGARKLYARLAIIDDVRKERYKEMAQRTI